MVGAREGGADGGTEKERKGERVCVECEGRERETGEKRERDCRGREGDETGRGGGGEMALDVGAAAR